MTDYVLLNQEQHANVKVITEHSIDYGDGVNFTMTFPFEFRNIQACYPIFFQKSTESGAFFPIALLGFEQNENLFLNDNGWDASYIPLMIRRQPFLIGFQADSENPEVKNPVVSIDMDNPRVSETEGEALFLEHGGTSEFLQAATQNLELIHQAHEHCEKYINALTENELIEPFSLDINLDNGAQNQLLGFYTLNEEKLQNLGAQILQEFSEKGFLMPAYMMLASHSRLRDLISLKNKAVHN